ncbi:MAG: glycosyltransferase family 39 protein [Aquabacterium sp.]
MVLVTVWVFTVSHHHTALHHDMAEQFVWAHAWQLGYPKHPPLPTWLFMSALSVLPPTPVTLYGLSALCIGLTGVFTFLAARELLPERAAISVALLWTLMQPFSWRAWIYNHNTVLVMTVALACHGTARAARLNSIGAWLLAGLGAGLAMSTKLQAAVPLLGLLWALWRSGALGKPGARRGLAWALALAVLVSAAPLLWMATGHTNALAYATHQLGSGEGEGESMRMGQFLASELRMLSPTLVVLLIWIIWAKQRHEVAPSDSAPTTSKAALGAWVQGLLLIPLLFVLAMGMLGGAKLHAQWGVQTFQFAPLALVIWFESAYERLPARQLLAVAAVTHVGGADPGRDAGWAQAACAWRGRGAIRRGSWLTRCWPTGGALPRTARCVTWRRLSSRAGNWRPTPAASRRCWKTMTRPRAPGWMSPR